MAVARSLESRNSIAIKDGLNLWLEYNSRLLKWQEKLGFPVVKCASDNALMKAKLKALLRVLELDADKNLEFFDAGLQTVPQAETDELPSDVQQVWEGLLARAL